MKSLLCLLVLSVVALPAFAGEVTIRETDTKIIVEYSPDEADREAAKMQEAERETKRLEEEKKEERRKAIEERRRAVREETHKED